MGIEPLGGCHGFDGMTDLADALLGDVLECYLSAIAVEVHSIVCHSVSVGGEGVVGAAGIITCTLTCILAEEHTAGIDNLLGQ